MKSNKNLNIPSILDNTPKECRLDVAFSLLTPLQQEIMRIFLEKKSALSIFQVRKKLIERWFEELQKEMKKIEPEINHPDNIPVVLFSENHYPGSMVLSKKSLQECISKYNVRESEHRKEGEKSLMSLKEKILKEIGVPVPVYSKVEHELNSMVTIGLLITIPTGERKTKCLYALDPRVAQKISMENK